MLLAVNNRREPLEVTFKTALRGRLGGVQDVLNGKSLNWKDNRLDDFFEPFGVHAYVFGVE